MLTSGQCRVRPEAEAVPRTLLGSAAGDIFGQLASRVEPEHLVETVNYRPSVNTRIPLFGRD